MTSKCSDLIGRLNEWYDEQSPSEQLFLADSRGDLEQNLHILESVENTQRIDYMLVLSSFMHRALFKPDEAAIRSHQAAHFLMSAYVDSENLKSHRQLPSLAVGDSENIKSWKYLLERYDGPDFSSFVGTTAVYFSKLAQKWGDEDDLLDVKSYVKQISSFVGKKEAPANSAALG